MKLFRFYSAFFKCCILMVAITSIPVAGELKLDSEENTTTAFGPTILEQEVPIYSQIILEQIVDKLKLYDSIKNEKNIEEKIIQENPSIQMLIKECQKHHTQPNCNMSLYRAYDGTCNNVNHPLWGSYKYLANRLFPAAYEGISGLRKSFDGGDLPNPRDISLKLIDRDNPTKDVSAMFTFFGQFFAHDVSSLSGLKRNGKPIECCTPSEKNNPECTNVYMSENDPFFKQFNKTCHSFARTTPYPKCNFDKRSPLYEQTSFVDASVIYGYNENLANDLRMKDGSGKLRFQNTVYGPLLPANHDQNQKFCPRDQTTNCFIAGDDRVNIHALLTTLHTVFMRFHNDIADKLHSMNPKWDEEKLYQETRRIVISVYQYIVYKEYVPWVVSPELIKRYKLSVDEESLYNEMVNPTAIVEFTTASFRMHSMVPKAVSKYSPNIRFSETYSNPNLVRGGTLESFVAGSCEVPSEKK